MPDFGKIALAKFLHDITLIFKNIYMTNGQK